eukprot:scpid67068/ scgid32608/ 
MKAAVCVLPALLVLLVLGEAAGVRQERGIAVLAALPLLSHRAHRTDDVEDAGHLTDKLRNTSPSTDGAAAGPKTTDSVAQLEEEAAAPTPASSSAPTAVELSAPVIQATSTSSAPSANQLTNVLAHTGVATVVGNNSSSSAVVVDASVVSTLAQTLTANRTPVQVTATSGTGATSSVSQPYTSSSSDVATISVSSPASSSNSAAADSDGVAASSNSTISSTGSNSAVNSATINTIGTLAPDTADGTPAATHVPQSESFTVVTSHVHQSHGNGATPNMTASVPARLPALALSDATHSTLVSNNKTSSQATVKTPEADPVQLGTTSSYAAVARATLGNRLNGSSATTSKVDHVEPLTVFTTNSTRAAASPGNMPTATSRPSTTAASDVARSSSSDGGIAATGVTSATRSLSATSSSNAVQHVPVTVNHSMLNLSSSSASVSTHGDLANSNVSGHVTISTPRVHTNKTITTSSSAGVTKQPIIAVSVEDSTTSPSTAAILTGRAEAAKPVASSVSRQSNMTSVEASTSAASNPTSSSSPAAVSTLFSTDSSVHVTTMPVISAELTNAMPSSHTAAASAAPISTATNTTPAMATEPSNVPGAATALTSPAGTDRATERLTSTVESEIPAAALQTLPHYRTGVVEHTTPIASSTLPPMETVEATAPESTSPQSATPVQLSSGSDVNNLRRVSTADSHTLRTSTLSKAFRVVTSTARSGMDGTTAIPSDRVLATSIPANVHTGQSLAIAQSSSASTSAAAVLSSGAAATTVALHTASATQRAVVSSSDRSYATDIPTTTPLHTDSISTAALLDT